MVSKSLIKGHRVVFVEVKPSPKCFSSLMSNPVVDDEENCGRDRAPPVQQAHVSMFPAYGGVDP